MQYDMVTTPITNETYHVDFLALVDGYFHDVEHADQPNSIPTPLVEPLTPKYTSLAPDQTYPAMIGVTSPWIDLGSYDPITAHVSQQVLNQEIAYAAFCGMNNIIIAGPPSQQSGRMRQSDVVSYARAIAQALTVGPYLQLHISLPMHEVDIENKAPSFKSLASRVRPEFSGQKGTSNRRADEDPTVRKDQAKDDWLSSWDVWDLIRSVCKYDTRLSIGTHIVNSISLLSLLNSTSCLYQDNDFPNHTSDHAIKTQMRSLRVLMYISYSPHSS